MIKKNKKGFTLMELLIVIFIITLIGTLVTVYFFQIRKNVRDSKRLSDISEIQLALENYKFFEGQYPAELIPGESLIGSTTEKIFLNKVPHNPGYYTFDCDYSEYNYSYDLNSDSYKISFCLEGGFENYNSGPKCAFMGEVFEGKCFFCENYVSDVDGNIYDTVAIGDQCWFQENLKYLPEVHSNTEFENQGNNGLPGYGVYGYDGSDVVTAKAQSNYSDYGVLYNWYAVNQSGSNAICPVNWHVPTSDEWIELIRYVINNPSCIPTSGCSPAGTYLKASSTDPIPNWNGDNSFGFFALPAGIRGINGAFLYLSNYTFFWSSSENGLSNSFYYFLGSGSSDVLFSYYDKSFGLSVRCLRNQ